MHEMLEEYETMIKIVVDTRIKVLAGGGEMHADCEQLLLEHGSEQDDLWGANWYPSDQRIEFEALINIRPRLGNRGILIQSQEIRQQVNAVARLILGGLIMKNKEKKQARFLKDPLPVRLASLAADLGRVASSARRETGAEAVAEMLEESQYFIEWTAMEAEPEIAAELVDMQRMIVLWRKAWPEIQQNVSQRTLLAVQAKKWSDQVLDFSRVD